MLVNSPEGEPPSHTDMSIVIINDLNICKQLWLDFVEGDEFLDNWDFRKLFSECIGAKPYFIALLKGNKFWGAIPLEHLPSKDKYYAFGGGIWNEYNHFYRV